MINRNIKQEVNTLAKEFPVVVLLGPRQSGKTTLAKMLFPKYRYVSLEDPDVRSFAKQDPRGFLKQYDEFVIFDEIQRIPELFSYIQTHVDKINKEGMFVLTGSHNYLLVEAITQSLAGRVGISTLLPFSVDEILSYKSKVLLDKIIFTGSYPRIYDKNIRPTSFYASYLSTYVERDIKLLQNIGNGDDFLKFLKILAGRSGQILNVLEISEQTGIKQSQIKEWISALKAGYIIFELKPYHKNYNKRLVKKSKIYFYDTGLLCYLLGIKSEEQYNSHYYKGNIFENFIIANLMKVNFNYAINAEFYFWRDNHKKEVDLIIEVGGKAKVVEIKSASTFRKEFLAGVDYINNLFKSDPKDSFLIYSGEKTVRNDVNIINWKDTKSILLD
jgi:uncharacterized protein